jgi:hypothetical protein
MDLITAISVGKSLIELGQEIAQLITKAQASPDVTRRVILYLEAAKDSVNALGLERQRILTDVRRCNISDSDQVNALWSRLDRYLHEDNIRPHLQSAIEGLAACRQANVKEAKGIRWRKQDKEAAVATFLNTFSELENLLRGLTYNFYPGGSGLGIEPLLPIYKLLNRLRHDFNLDQPPAEPELVHKDLEELMLQALSHNTHEEWFRTTGRAEATIAELQLAFSMTVDEALTIRGTQ